MSSTRSLEFLVDDVKRAMAEERPCTLLIGAGCSVTAGIPTAQGFVDRIKRDYQHRWELAPTKTYAECMAQLEIGDRDRLIQRCIEGAKVNLAHLAIASLIRDGYVDRVLTTNFDPLVVQACALLNQFPAVYDCAASTAIDPQQISGRAVFHLHGQYRGPILINTGKELRRNARRVCPVVKDALGRGRIIIVVGYSGYNDPVFDALARPRSFRTPVVWVSYKDEPPPDHVSKKLLPEGKGAYRVEAYTADGFFVALAQALNAFPPDLLRRPFSHLQDCLASLRTDSELRLRGQEEPIRYEFGLDARKWIELARAVFEQGSDQSLDVTQLARERRKADAEELLLAGRYADLAAMHQAADRETSLALAGTFAPGYALWGSELTGRALQHARDQAMGVLKDACEKYAIADKLDPDSYEVLCAWGNALALWAERALGKEADTLVAEASQKYQRALKIKPDSPEVLNNLGNILTSQARRKEPSQALPLLTQAYARYAEATRLDPHDHVALTNWADALYEEASHADPPDRDALLNDACSKCEAALKIKAKSHFALSVYGNCLARQAEHADESASDALFQKACSQYQKATDIKDDYFEALANWGRALSAWAQRKGGKRREELYAQALGKYEAAIKIRPFSDPALHNWGHTLVQMALRGGEARRKGLLREACEKFSAAVAARPERHDSLHCWSLTLCSLAQLAAGDERERLLGEAIGKFGEAAEIRSDPVGQLAWGEALSSLARMKDGPEVEQLLTQARQHYEAAIEGMPGAAPPLSGLAAVLLGLGGLKEGPEATALFSEAKEKAVEAERLEPGVGAYNAACACARLGEKDECRTWLERCRDLGALQSRKHMQEEDEDLASVRSKKWFREILDRAPEQEPFPPPPPRAQ